MQVPELSRSFSFSNQKTEEPGTKTKCETSNNETVEGVTLRIQSAAMFLHEGKNHGIVTLLKREWGLKQKWFGDADGIWRLNWNRKFLSYTCGSRWTRNDMHWQFRDDPGRADQAIIMMSVFSYLVNVFIRIKSDMGPDAIWAQMRMFTYFRDFFQMILNQH